MNFINLFIIPIISLSVLLNGKDINKFTKFDYVSKYCNFVVLNVVFANMLRHIIKYLVGLKFETSSLLYTIIATIVAVILALFVKSIEFKWIEKKQRINQKDKKSNEECKDEDKKS